MSQDFVTTLRLQLRDAAEREARKGPLRRALPNPRPLLLVGAMAAAAVAVVLAVGTLHTTPQAPTTRAPQIVSRLAVADQGGALSSAYGSLWTYDNTGVLRLGPDGSIVARIPIRGDINDAYAGTGGMWAMTDDHLYRIDPRTNRIVARIPLPPPSRSFTAVSTDGAVWAVNSDLALQIDLATNRTGRRVSLDRGGEAPSGFAAEPGRVYMLRRDGLLETLDSRTFGRIALIRPELNDPLVGAAHGEIFQQAGAGMSAADARTGKLLWRTNLGTRSVNGVIEGLGALWVQGTPVTGSRDQLWKLDPRSGTVLAALKLPDFGTSSMVTAHGRVWIMSSGGKLTAIR